jgi:glycerol-3-phosphate acyltransferase PlsY
VIRKLEGLDIREHGSGNPDATNAVRVLGWKSGILVLLMDGFKGWLPAAFYAGNLFMLQPITEPGLIQIMCGFAAVLGHTYPVIGGFKGGKGVATLAGMLIAVYPTILPLCIGVFVTTVAVTGFVSLGSILASASLPVFLLVLPAITQFQTAPLSLLVFSLLVPWFIIFTHRSNISRIRTGTENRFEKTILFKRDTE